MCPECIPTVVVLTAGASSVGSPSLIFINNLVRTMREKALHSDSRERTQNDQEPMGRSKVVSREDWLRARKELLTQEKHLTRQRDESDRRRRELGPGREELRLRRPIRARNTGRPFRRPDSTDRDRAAFQPG